MENTFINPLEDPCFKTLFGPKIGRKNMLNFLRALLPQLGIAEIEYLDTEQMGLSPEEGKSVFDLSVLTGDGSRVIIEMQKTNLRHFNYRSVYYTSHAVQVQAARERDRQRDELIARRCEPYWNYWFPPVYFIGVLVNGMGGQGTGDGKPYIREFRLRDTKTGEDMGVELNFCYLCLDRFCKSAEESRDLTDRFMYSLKNIYGLKEMPESFGDSEAMIELYERSMLANQPVETLHEIEVHRNMTTKNDILVAIAEAREDAREMALAEGEAIGMSKGRAEGKAEGRAEGEARGRAEGKSEVARAMLGRGMDIAVIADVTGLSTEQIRAL